jgi:hypothetical protein
MPRKPGTSRAKHTLTMMPHSLPGAGGDGPQPVVLTGERRKLWDDIRSQFVLEKASESLLRNACESLERAAQLAEQVSRDGATFRDRFGGVKVNPAAQLERDFRGLASRTLQQLAARLED